MRRVIRIRLVGVVASAGRGSDAATAADVRAGRGGGASRVEVVGQ